MTWAKKKRKYHYRVDNKINLLSTPWCSRAVPQPSTDLALHRFAAEFGWDPAFSMQYGRQPMCIIVCVEVWDKTAAAIGCTYNTIITKAHQGPSIVLVGSLLTGHLCRVAVGESTGRHSTRLTTQYNWLSVERFNACWLIDTRLGSHTIINDVVTSCCTSIEMCFVSKHV